MVEQDQDFLSEGPNLDILWVFRDEIGSVRTRIVDLMTISVSKVFFYMVFEDFGLSESSSNNRFLKKYVSKKRNFGKSEILKYPIKKYFRHRNRD